METGNENLKGVKLTINQWWGFVGTKKVKLVADAMGTSIHYMRRMKRREARPSYDFAMKLIATASVVTPDIQPDFHTIMQPLEKKRGKDGAPTVEAERQAVRGEA